MELMIYAQAGRILHGGNEGDCLHAPLDSASVPLKCYSNVQLPHRVPFTKKKYLVHLPFQKRSTYRHAL